MARRIFWLCFLLVLAAPIRSQITGVFAEVGGNHIAEYDQGFAPESQFALRTAIGLDLGERMSAGIRIHQLWYRGFQTAGYEDFQLIGPFVRYGSKIGHKARFFGNVGFSRGNFCTCGGAAGDSFRQAGLYYFIWGGGFEARLYPGIHFNGEMYFHQILNYGSPTLGYNGYLVGLVFHLRNANLSS